jgi:hypothetical protein
MSKIISNYTKRRQNLAQQPSLKDANGRQLYFAQLPGYSLQRRLFPKYFSSHFLKKLAKVYYQQIFSEKIKT